MGSALNSFYGFTSPHCVGGLAALLGCGLILTVLSEPHQPSTMSAAAGDDAIMLDSSGNKWNGESIPYDAARSTLGWNPWMDVVGAGVYGGIVKRDPSTGKILLGHEWPENNVDWNAGPHNSVAPHKGLRSPYLDYAQTTRGNRGYSYISNLVTGGDPQGLQRLFEQLGADTAKRSTLANLVMAGGARPLHMAGMTHGGNPAAVVRILIAEGAQPNAMDNYGMTPLDRMLSNRVAADELRRLGGTKRGPLKPDAVPDWGRDEFAYTGGIGEAPPH